MLLFFLAFCSDNREQSAKFTRQGAEDSHRYGLLTIHITRLYGYIAPRLEPESIGQSFSRGIMEIRSNTCSRHAWRDRHPMWNVPRRYVHFLASSTSLVLRQIDQREIRPLFLAKKKDGILESER